MIKGDDHVQAVPIRRQLALFLGIRLYHRARRYAARYDLIMLDAFSSDAFPVPCQREGAPPSARGEPRCLRQASASRGNNGQEFRARGAGPAIGWQRLNPDSHAVWSDGYANIFGGIWTASALIRHVLAQPSAWSEEIATNVAEL
jgi:hypothetical protein